MHAEVETFRILESYESVTCVTGVRNHGNFGLEQSSLAAFVFSMSPMQSNCLSLEAEFTAEVLKLSFIRASKGRRFRYALWATGAFYALVFVSFLVLRHCA